jgi:integrase
MATFRKRLGRPDAQGNRSESIHVMVRRAGYPTRTSSFPNQREAKKWAATVEAEMIEGRHFKDVLGRKRTLGEAIDRYLKEILPQKRDGSMYRFTLRWWKDNHAEKKLGEISRGWLVERRSDLLTGTFTRATPGSKRSDATEAKAFARTPATANRYMAALSHVFTMICGDWEWLQPGSNPFQGLSKLRESKGRTRHLSDEERAALAQETAKDPQLNVLVHVALATGARAGELVDLPRDLVELTEEGAENPEGRLVFVDTKNGETRVAWVFGDVLELLRAHIAGLSDKSPLVFPGMWSHKHQKFGRYDYMPRLRKALKAAGIDNFRFHDLRHTAATGLARMGASEQQLKAIHGWKSGMAAKYVHLAAQDIKSTVQKYQGQK